MPSRMGRDLRRCLDAVSLRRVRRAEVRLSRRPERVLARSRGTCASSGGALSGGRVGTYLLASPTRHYGLGRLLHRNFWHW